MTTELSKRRRCMATTVSGLPCRAWASESGYCPLHSANKHAIQVAGGRSKSKYHMLEKKMNPALRDTVDLLRQAAEEVHRGAISPQQGSSLASIATALIRAVESAELALRLSILEVRLKGDVDESEE